MLGQREFLPTPPLAPGAAHAACRAAVILPARNEEDSLAAALHALATQVDTSGKPLPPDTFEVLLLLNNCTDGSAAVALRWKAAHPQTKLHVIERDLPPELAHVGTARRLLMDTAWRRLPGGDHSRGILSTDADTLVAPDWIAQNLRALDGGADAVGGAICLKHDELQRLPAGARHAYSQDRRYQQLVAELEDLIDPQNGDPWPRHLEHFGASLACTPQAYARAGGMPAVTPLEDLAFVDALRRVDARLRHEPAVMVYTSSRLDGRAGIGLSNQLRLWQQMSEQDEEQRVPSAAFLIHRFRTLRNLRSLCVDASPARLAEYSGAWRPRIADAIRHRTSVGEFLAEIDCDRLIEETFHGVGEGPIVEVNPRLAQAIRRIRRGKNPAGLTQDRLALRSAHAGDGIERAS